MKVISIITNNPIFITLQYLSLKKYINVPYEYIVFNDGKNYPDFTNNNTPNKHIITEKCQELGIKCIEIENDSTKNTHDCSLRHAHSLKEVLKYMKENLDEYLIIDGDMFLIDNLDINKYRKYSCACVLQKRIKPAFQLYIWPNFFYMNTSTINDIDILNLGIDRGDTGSASQKWLLKQEPVENFPDPATIRYSDPNEEFMINKLYFIKHLWSCTWNIDELPNNLKNNNNLIEFLKNDKRNQKRNYFAEIYDNTFFHYRASTWYMIKNYNMHNEQIKSLIYLI